METSLTTAEPQRQPFPPRWLVVVVILFVVTGAVWLFRGRFSDDRLAKVRFAAEAAAAEENWSETERLCAEWLRQEPGRSRPLLLLADAARAKQDAAGTAEILGRVDDSDPGAVDLLLLQGDLYFLELQLVSEAERTWQRILTIEPSSREARQHLIHYYAMTSQRAKLVATIRQTIDLRCENTEAYVYLVLAQQLKFGDALHKNSAWLKVEPNQEALRVGRAISLARGSTHLDPRLYREGDLKPGDTSLVEQCLREFPQNLELLAFRLEKLIDQGDQPAVEQSLSKLPPTADAEARFQRYRGWLAMSRNQSPEAETFYRRALELDPFDWRARHELSQVLRVQRRPQEAEPLAKLAVRGKELERKLFELPSAAEASTDVLWEISDYAEAAGAQFVVEALARRLPTRESAGRESAALP